MLETLKSIFDLADGLGTSKNPRNSVLHGVDAPATASSLAVASSVMMVTG